MSNKKIRIELAEGFTTSDSNILEQEIIRKAIYDLTEQNLVGKAGVVMNSVNAIELRLDLPKDPNLRFDAKRSSEMGRKGRQRLEWYSIYDVLDKYQVEIMISDETKVKQLAGLQTRLSIEAAARGMAYQIDTHIFDALIAGAGDNAVATDEWDTTSADVSGDIANAIKKIKQNAVPTAYELANIVVFYPFEIEGYLKKLIEIENMHRSVLGYMQQMWPGMQFLPTDKLTDDALVVVKGMGTAQHYTYTGMDVPTVEEKREFGEGDLRLITEYFKTVIVPEEEGGSTNNKIFKITNVVT